MSVIDMKGRLVMDEPLKEPDEQDVAYMLSQAEQGFRAMRIIATMRPALLQNARIEHDGLTYGVAAFLQVIRQHMDCISLTARERQP